MRVWAGKDGWATIALVMDYQNPRNPRVASLAVQHGFNSDFGIGARFDRAVRGAGASGETIPAPQRQRVGFYIPQIHGARSRLRSAAPLS